MAAKRERELARIVDRDFKGRNGGNLFDSGAAVFFDGVGTVMDVVVGDGAVLFDGVGTVMDVVIGGGAVVFDGVGTVMDVVVGDGAVGVFSGDDLVHGAEHCCCWEEGRIGGFRRITLRG